VLTLLETLQRGGLHRAADLARSLEVDERTLRRYIAQLLELDVPVEAVRGRYGGYRLAPGYRMPPLMLTDAEAMSVVLGIVAGQRAGLAVADPEAAASATAKVLRVLPTPTRARLDALLETLGLRESAPAGAAPEAATVLLVASAARERHPVSFFYRARDGRPSERTLLPYGVVADEGRWYVTGHDTSSGERRTFRLDRMSRLRTHAGTFAAPRDADPTTAVLDSLASTPWRHEVVVRVQATPEHARTRLRPGLARIVELADDPGWVRVQIRAEALDWVPAVLVGLERPFVVEQPQELRTMVAALAERLKAWAGTAPGCTVRSSP